jgi:arylsulfatase A-like enzyme
MADDVGMGDIGSVYWDTDTGKVKMDNIAELASKGVIFTDMHSTPLCAPSRYNLLAGSYAHRGRKPAGTWSVGGKSNENHFLPGQLSIADVLKDGGDYNTAMMGKWHIGATIPRIGNSAVDPSGVMTDERVDWSLPLGGGAHDLGFQSSYLSTSGLQGPPYVFFRDGYLASDESNIVHYENSTFHRRPHGVSMIAKAGEGDKDWDSTAYNMILVNETESFLHSHFVTRKEDPFFAYVALGAVHEPHSPPDTYIDGSPVAGEYESSHMDLLGELDKVVGSLIALLEKRQLLDDTIIIFTSDNGGLGQSEEYGHKASGPLRGYKGQIHEGGHRVPMIIRWDGVFPQGETRDHHISLTDIYATLCDFAEVDIPENQALDSYSFADYVTDSEKTESLRTYLGTWRFKKNQLVQESIRKGKYKLIKHNWDSSVQLFDLNSDLSETTDLSSDPIYMPLIYEMLAELRDIGPGSNFEEGKGIGATHETKFNIEADSEEEYLKNCDWFARKSYGRCKNNIDAGEAFCAITCGEDENAIRVPPSLDGYKLKKFTVDEAVGKKSCEWFSLYLPRCDQYRKGRKMCPDICTNGSKNNPTQAPTKKKEKEKKFKVEGLKGKKSCSWFTRKPFRCSKYVEGKNKCPEICGSSYPTKSPTYDHSQKFKVVGEGRRSCDWFGRKKVRCSKHIEGKQNCPNECV